MHACAEGQIAILSLTTSDEPLIVSEWGRGAGDGDARGEDGRE